MMLRKWLPLLTALVFGLALAIMAITPPSPRGIDTPSDAFSSARAMEHVRIIAAEPHPTGSDANAEVRTYLINELDVLGLEVQTSESFLPERGLARLNRWSGEALSEQAIHNVIGIRRGADPKKPALLLMAHHDTVWGSPGSADDTIGIASILEIIRTLNQIGLQDRDLIVLFTDAEELGLFGARHFFAEHPLRKTVGAVINFEARGGGGTANLFQTSANNGESARLFARSVKHPSASSLSTFIYNILPNDTDLTPALEHDYVAYNIANIGNAEYYHSPKISPDALAESTLQHMGAQGLDLARALLSTNTLPAPKPDIIFFDLFGIFTVIYGSAWGSAFIVITGTLSVLSNNGNVPRQNIWGGASRMIAFLLIGGGILFGLNVLSGSGGASDYYDRLAAIPKLEIMTILTCFGVFFGIFGCKALNQNGQIGAMFPLVLLAGLGQIFAPTASYFIILTVLLCAIGNFLMRRQKHHRRPRLINVVIAALVVGYMAQLGHLLMLGVGPDLPSVAILTAALATLAILPLYRGVPKIVASGLVGLCLVSAIAIAIWVRLDPIAITVPLY